MRIWSFYNALLSARLGIGNGFVTLTVKTYSTDYESKQTHAPFLFHVNSISHSNTHTHINSRHQLQIVIE